MTGWSLSQLLVSLHEEIQQKLDTARKSMGHPVSKGDASEKVWIELLDKYLPCRYSTKKAYVVDSNNKFSDQIDIVIFDRQYSPFMFNFNGQIVIPAESVYAVFEAKQATNLSQIKYAGEKIASVRNLHRTTLPIPHAGGTYPAKTPSHIIGGILTLESEWTPPFGTPLNNALDNILDDKRLDLGCVAAHGYFCLDFDNDIYNFFSDGKAATGFLFSLISMLQSYATVPMVDIEAYARWLTK